MSERCRPRQHAEGLKGRSCGSRGGLEWVKQRSGVSSGDKLDLDRGSLRKIWEITCIGGIGL